MSSNHKVGRSESDWEDNESRSVAEVMGTHLFTVTPDTGVAAALRLADKKKVNFFLVVDDGGLTGIVCDRDLHSARSGTMVSDCMSSPVLCISPETTVDEAEGIMDENAVDCLPVVTGQYLVGMVTRETLNRLDVASVRRPSTSNLNCVACGSSWRVTRDFRSNCIPLCGGCLGIGEAPTKRHGN